MKIGVLRTGWPPRAVQAEYGTYPDMFRRLLGEDAYDWAEFGVDQGVLPAAPEACDAYIITGSARGVYDVDPWIGQLIDFLRAAKGRARLVGVCFGHQVMAQAFGGQVIQSPKGWAIGAQDYGVVGREPWMEGAASVRLPASHQDQVVALPPGAEVILASAFTPMAGLIYRDQPAISIQPHPEFEPAYAKALIESRREVVYSDTHAQAAMASYDLPDDRVRVAGWIQRFLAG